MSKCNTLVYSNKAEPKTVIDPVKVWWEKHIEKEVKARLTDNTGTPDESRGNS
jgi:hypothetical protein